jgi:hypothetical protein
LRRVNAACRINAAVNVLVAKAARPARLEAI